MIVVLCGSYDEAKEAFEYFLELLYYLSDWESYTIETRYDECLCVQTEDDLRYIFVDYRFENLFIKMKADIIDIDEFFQDIHEYYCDFEL